MTHFSHHNYWLFLVILLMSLCPVQRLQAQESADAPRKAAIQALRGDVNNDGKRTVTDCMILVSYILDENSVQFDFEVGDVNHDNVITVTDVMIIVGIILGEPYQDEDNPIIRVDDDLPGGDPGQGI